MDSAARELTVKTRRLIGLQIAIGLLAAAGFFVIRGPWEALSAGYGGAISLLSSWLLGRSVRRAAERAQGGATTLYVGAALRFVLVLVLFGVGLALLRLAPLACVLGFVAVQSTFLLAMQGRR